MHETAQNPVPLLLTSDQHEQLLANGRQRDVDHVPVVKFFNPVGIGTWLATELDQDRDTCFGIADLGVPELGTFSLEELATLELPFGMCIERDVFFTGEFPISAMPTPRVRQAASPRPSVSFPTQRVLPEGRGTDAFSPLAQARTLSRHVA